MANLVRLPKSGSAWGPNELLAYNISIVEEDQQTFFRGPLPDYAGPVGFAQNEDYVQGLDAPSLALIKRLNLVIDDGNESAMDNFVPELLRSMGYETEETVVRTQKNIQLDI